MNNADRNFFINIKKAITSNPFSRERTAVDRELAGVTETNREPSDVFAQLLARVSEKLRNFEKTRAKKSAESSEDRPI